MSHNLNLFCKVWRRSGKFLSDAYEGGKVPRSRNRFCGAAGRRAVLNEMVAPSVSTRASLTRSALIATGHGLQMGRVRCLIVKAGELCFGKF